MGKLKEDLADEAWKILEPKFIDMLNLNTFNFNWEECHRNSYSLVIWGYGDKLYVGLKKLIHQHLCEVIRSQILDSSDIAIFSNLNECWNNYFTSIIEITNTVVYLNRVYVQQQRRDLQPIKELGYQMFRDEIILNPIVNNRIKAAIHKMTQMGRQNNHIDSTSLNLFRDQTLPSLGYDKSYYQKEFEEWIIGKCAENYRRIAPTFLKENNACKFVLHINNFMKNEIECVGKFIDPTSISNLKNVILVELIPINHVDIIINMENSGVLYMLENNCSDEFNLLHDLFKDVPAALNLMTPLVCKHFKDHNSKHFDEINGYLKSKNSVEYVQSLYDLKKELDLFMDNYFKVQSQLTLNIQDEVKDLLNPNMKLLVLCFHDRLKKESEIMNEKDGIIVKAVEIFKITKEKDVFEKHYKNHFAKRLLSDKKCSTDNEKFVILQLKNECGTDYTRKIEGLLNDIEISNTLMNEYKNVSNKNSIDFSVKVLTKCFWPLPEFQPCILPASAESAFNGFRDFYYNKYSGRVLKINPNFGFVDLKATFYKKDTDGSIREETKILIVTTLQMCILMKFNESESFTFKKLLDDTKICDRDLRRALESMAMGKESQRILARIGNGEDIEENDIFSVNDEFTSKFNRIRIQMIPSKTNAEFEQKEFQAKITDDRKYEIEAAIIRMMKSKQNLTHNDLITEVTKQLQPRFLPDPIIIKKQIESLIEREYLKRDTENLNLYHYIS